MCGENDIERIASTYHAETPPHVRGKPALAEPPRKTRRNTPACAGKTNHRLPRVEVHRKRPRMCGENFQSDRVISSVTETPPHVRGKPPERPASRSGQETPPHVRGKLPEAVSTDRQEGNTPACAGKTLREQ
jgi:hypothetical protein